MNTLLWAALCLAPVQEAALEDFEEDAPPGGFAPGWRRLEDDLHPSYNEALLVTDPAAARSGRRYLLLRTQGGAAAVEMSAKRAWPVEAGRPYRLSGWIRTASSQANAASLRLLWLNRRFDPLGESASLPFRGGGGWRELVLELPPAPPGALWAAVRLTYEGPDVRGECAFDRLSLAPAVRLDVRPEGRALPVFEAAKPVRFDLHAVGLGRGEHAIDAEVSGPSGPEFRLARTLRLPALLEFPPLAPGAYRLTVSIAASGIRREVPLLAAAPRSAAASPFGLVFNPFASDPPAPGELLHWAGARRAEVVLWDQPPPGRGSPPTSDALSAFLLDLSRGAPDDLHVTAVLARPPHGLLPGRTFATLAEWMALDREVREKPLRILVSRFREAAHSWKLGDGEEVPAVLPDELLKPSPAGPRTKTIRAVDIPGLLKALVVHAAQGPGAPPAVVPAGPPILDADGGPAAGLLAFRSVGNLLAGAKPREGLPLLGAPVREFQFEKDGRILLAVWSEDGPVEREIQMGPGARLHPPLGAERDLASGERLRIGDLPLFIAGADPFLLESQSSLQISDATLPLRADPVLRQLRFRNLSPDRPITDLRIRVEPGYPADWILRPLSVSADRLGPLQEASRDLAFTLPPTETEREQELRFEIRFQRDGREHALQTTRRVRLASPIAVEALARPAPDDPRARLVSLRVTNGTDRAVNLLLRVRYPGLPESLEPLGRLAAGARSETPEVRVSIPAGLPEDRRVVEVLGEESGGDRLQFRKRFPLR